MEGKKAQRRLVFSMPPQETARDQRSCSNTNRARKNLSAEARRRAMPKKKSPDEDPAKQHARFKETAREHGADKSGKAFERAFEKIVPPVKPTGKKGAK
jgi:hypothetical protein